MMIRVVIVDDHPLARAALRDVLDDGATFTLVGEASNGEEALALCTTAAPDVVVMDCQMPGMSGIKTTHELTRCFSSIAVVLLSTVVTDALQQEAAQAGAYQLLTKAIRASALRAFIQQAAQQRGS